MATYKGKLRSKDEELDCNCEGRDIERKLSDYQKHIINCMRMFSPRGHSVEENKRLMMDKFRSCAEEWTRWKKPGARRY